MSHIDLSAVSREALEAWARAGLEACPEHWGGSLSRIRAEAARAEPVLCHPTDPCEHGITGPCGKCQPTPPLRTRDDAARELIDAIAFPTGRDFASAWEHACTLFGRFGARPVLLLAALPAVTEAERAVLVSECDLSTDRSALTAIGDAVSFFGDDPPKAVAMIRCMLARRAAEGEVNRG